MSKLARYFALFLGTLGALYILWLFHSVVLLFGFSLVIGAALRPAIQRLIERGVPRGIAFGLVYFGAVGLPLVAGVLVGIGLLDEGQQLLSFFAFEYEWLNENGSTVGWQQMLAENLPAPEQLYNSLFEGENVEINAALTAGLTRMASLAAAVPIVIVASLYWATGQDQFERLWLSLLAPEQRMTARQTWREIEAELGGWVRSEVTQSFLLLIILYPLFAFLGFDYPTAMATAVALFWLFPLIGGLPAVATVGLLAFGESTGGIVAAMVMAAATLLFMEYVVEPRFLYRGRHNPIILALVLLVLVDSVGLIGVIPAIPLAAALQIAFRRLMQGRMRSEESAEIQISTLADRAEALRNRFENPESPFPAEVGGLLNRLDKLIGEAGGKSAETA